MSKESIKAFKIDKYNKKLMEKYCFDCINYNNCKYTIRECRKNFYKIKKDNSNIDK